MNRLQWLDAMRGFTMLLVVMYHVTHISFGMTDKLSSCQPFLVLFRMPLFFFVSGFLAYKASLEWTVSDLRKLLFKKFMVQTIPAFIFLCISVLLLHRHYWDTFIGSLHSPTKGGYWFTWVLLQMFVLYYLVCFTCRRISKKNTVTVGALIGTMVVFIALYALSYMPPVMKELPDGVRTFLNTSSFIQTIHYFQFFLFGNLVHRFWEQSQKLMDTQWFFIVVIILAFVGTGDCLVWHNLKFMWRNLPLTVASYTLLMLVVMFFRYYESWFTTNRAIGQALQYVGRRTLDVYLIHFLFLPSLPMVGQWMNAHRHNFVLDFCLSATVAIIVIAFCLATSNLLRINPLLRKLLFGVTK